MVLLHCYFGCYQWGSQFVFQIDCRIWFLVPRIRFLVQDLKNLIKSLEIRKICWRWQSSIKDWTPDIHRSNEKLIYQNLTAKNWAYLDLWHTSFMTDTTLRPMIINDEDDDQSGWGWLGGWEVRGRNSDYSPAGAANQPDPSWPYHSFYHIRCCHHDHVHCSLGKLWLLAR